MAKRYLDVLNGPRHETAMRIFMFIVLAHWGEHLLQGLQIYVLGWPVPEARGALGYFFPALISSEALHYGYALVMLIGLWALRPGFTETDDRRWWTVALGIQFFHHFEHFLLLAQRVAGYNLLDRPVPTSIAQLWIPRVELHLFYNTIVFLPMVVAMYFHMFPPARAGRPACTCAWDRKVSPAAV
ncbi:MAG TPA: hypothetical protein VFV78_01710 [Vicinamibacterales bacterium]|nr:hypothetical protein [Vicinamibacterales bacterium]